MERFEKLLTCGICLDRYRNPKLLPCQHSFCMEPCLDGLVDYARRQVKCPECRAEHRIPYQGVQGFPTNVTLQRFLELHIEITRELPDPVSGQMMQRCNVCSEKAYCNFCCHCDKKICDECKAAHIDILRREIARINHQIRRGIRRLQDALALVERNTENIQINCLSVTEEVDEIYRRLSKAIKDRTEYLRSELDRYVGSEMRSLRNFKDNLELEVANITSNCDLADKHVKEDVNWDDCELMDCKEIFARTVDFIRNFDYETSDYSRKVRLVLAHDPNQLALNVASYGDLNVSNSLRAASTYTPGSHLQAPPVAGNAPGLMRSKSDHRLASQYRQQQQQDEKSGYDRGGGGGGGYGDAGDDLPLSGRKFGEKPKQTIPTNRYTYDRDRVVDYGDEYDNESSQPGRSRYRSSRYNRHQVGGEDSDSDGLVGRGGSVQIDSKDRKRVIDTEDVARGPLSGITRLADSPRVMQKLKEARSGKNKRERETSVTTVAAVTAQTLNHHTSTVGPNRSPPPTTVEGVAEEDEIAKIKRQNIDATASTIAAVEHEPRAQPPTIKGALERVTATKREEPEERHLSTGKTTPP